MQIQASTVKPQFYVSTLRETGNGSTPPSGTGNVIGGAGLTTLQGVTQSVRAAGDGNTAYNNVAINVKEDSHAPAVEPVQGQVLTSGQTITDSNAAGNVAVSTTGGGGVQMAIQANNNQGTAMQQAAQGGLVQNTRLLGNSNRVNNLTQLNVVLNNNGRNAGAVNCNLNQLRALRSLGY
jgi:hypothetical protein